MRRKKTEDEVVQHIAEKYAWLTYGHLVRISQQSYDSDRIRNRLIKEFGWVERTCKLSVKMRDSLVLFDSRIPVEFFDQFGRAYKGYKSQMPTIRLAKPTSVGAWLNGVIKSEMERFK